VSSINSLLVCLLYILVIGVITTAITNLWGIIPFELLLPAGILALRFKKRKATTAKKEEEEEKRGSRRAGRKLF
jgi:Na+-driven multidrug efflux pump